MTVSTSNHQSQLLRKQNLQTILRPFFCKPAANTKQFYTMCPYMFPPLAQGVLLPCPTTLSAVNTSRQQISQLLTAQQALSLHALDPLTSAVNPLAGCVVLVPLNALTEEHWSVSHMRLAGAAQSNSKPRIHNHLPTGSVPEIQSHDYSAGLRARQVSSVTSFVNHQSSGE